MQMSTNKERLYINQIVGQKLDSIIVEEDVVVPDIKPDILNTISTNGNICVYKKEIIDGKVKIEGCINTYIIYLSEDMELTTRGINTNIDFTQIIDMPNVKEGMMVEAKLVLKDIECKVLNGRKINIKAIVDINTKVLSNEEVEFINKVEECRDIQLLNENMELNSLLGRGSTKVYAKDTLMLDGIDNLLEVLNFDIKVLNKELKVSYNKVLVKADVYVKILYLTEDNRICKISQIIPIMGFIDMQDISEEDICNIEFEIKNIIVKPNNVDDHSIYVEIEFEISCTSYQTKQIDIIQDLYSPSISLRYSKKIVKTISDDINIKNVYSIRENRSISEIGNSKIYDVEVKPIIRKQTNLNNRVVVEGDTSIKFIYEGNNNGIDINTINIPFNNSIDISGVNQNSEVDINIDVTLEDFTVMSDQDIDIKIDLEFNCNLNNTRTLNVIDEIEEDEKRECDKHSLTIYFVKPNDTLWEIAKKFNSTIDKIKEVNQLEEVNKLNVGEQLFIPICV